MSKIARESGNKKSSIKYFTDNRPVDKKGNPLPMAVAMLAKCVAHYRQRLRPLKTIYLCPHYYNQVDHFVRSHATEKEGDISWNMLTFDGVEIHKMGELHILKSKEGSSDMDWDFYPPKKIEGNA